MSASRPTTTVEPLPPAFNALRVVEAPPVNSLDADTVSVSMSTKAFVM